MNGTTILEAAGQRLWLDTISRRLLDSGALHYYIDTYGLGGVTSNPTILKREIAGDARALARPQDGVPPDVDPETQVFEEAVRNVQRAADLLRPQWDSTDGHDGWVSIEVSPALADSPAATVSEGRRLYAHVDRPNVFIKVPATRAGARAIEALTFAGIPVNATLIFDPWQHEVTEASFMRGLERRHARRLPLGVASVASVFVSRWDQATNPHLPSEYQNTAGLAAAHEIQESHRRTLASPRWARLAAAGAEPQRIVWASTSVKDPLLPATYYAERLPIAGTINTMPEDTLLAVAHSPSLHLVSAEPHQADELWRALAASGTGKRRIADSLQREGVARFAADWSELLGTVAAQTRTAAPSGSTHPANVGVSIAHYRGGTTS